MNAFNNIFTTRKLKGQYRFLILCFFWFFLVVPLSKSSETFIDIIKYGNYLLIVLLPIWAYNVLYRNKNTYEYNKLKLLKKIIMPLSLFLLILGLQVFINPDTSELFKFRRLSAAVIPSISLTILAVFYTLGAPKRQSAMIRVLFIVLFLIVLFSEFGIGINTHESLKVTREGGIIREANIYGYFLALLFILSVAEYSGNIRIIGIRYTNVVILLITFILILRTGSYGALIFSMLCCLPLFIKTSSTGRFFGMIVSVSIFVFVLLLGIKLTSLKTSNYKTAALISAILDKSTDSVYRASTFLLRFEVIISGIKKLSDKPIFGYGYSDRKAYSLSRRKSIAVHNAFVVQSLKGGVFVGIVMLIFYWRMISYVLKIKESNIKVLALSLLLFMFLVDNVQTSFGFLSLESSTIAFSILMILLVNNMFLKSGQLHQPGRVEQS